MSFCFKPRLPLTSFSVLPRRSFVSTVLLFRTWENETVVELRREAKARGLSTYVPPESTESAFPLVPDQKSSSKGNKSTLVTRIREHEQDSLTCSSSIHTPGAARNTSTNVTVNPRKTFQAASPGIPLAALPDSASANIDYLATKLPNPFHPPPNPPVQVPYVPDFWNSARHKDEASLEPVLPKLYVVSGSVTHYDGGPTHNLEKHRETGLPSATIQPDESPDSEIGLWADFRQYLGLSNLTKEDGPHTFSRPLTNEERKGLYVLLGIIGGSWLLGGFMNRPTTVAKEHDIQN